MRNLLVAFRCLTIAASLLPLVPRACPGQRLNGSRVGLSQMATAPGSVPVAAAMQRHESHWVEGAVIGAALGAAIAVVGSHPHHVEFGGLTLAFALSGALLGALIGLLVAG
jgi:hypothetical protein